MNEDITSKKILDKSTARKASYCLKCNQAYYQNRAQYDKAQHRFICPNCGK